MRSPAAPTASGCWRGSSGPTCSWCRWMRCVAGGATTSCSPTCCGRACGSNSRSGWLGCTAPLPPGQRRMGWPTMPCATRWPRATPRGRRGWPSGTPTSCCCAARGRRCGGGLRCCPPSWSAPGPGCCWHGRAWRCSAAAWRGSMSCWTAPSAPWRRLPMSPMSRRPAGRRALAEIGEDEWMLQSNASGYLGVAEWLRGRLAAAERLLSATIAQWLRAGQRQLAVRTCHHLGQVQRAQGRPDAALGTYRQALEVAAPPGQPALPDAGIARVGLAEVAYQRGELDAALEHLTEGLGPCRQVVYTPPLATGLATLAWIRQAQGDLAGALDAIDEAEGVAPSRGVATLLNPAPALRARLLLASGELAAAVRWTEQRGLGADDQPSYPHEPEYLVLARVLLAQDRPDQALGLLERLHTAARAQGRLGSLIEIQALRALALAGSGEEAAAVAVLAEALTLACPQGYVRVFADEGAPMAALLGRLVAAQRAEQTPAAGVPLDCLARLLRAFDATHAGRGGAAAVAGLV